MKEVFVVIKHEYRSKFIRLASFTVFYKYKP